MEEILLWQDKGFHHRKVGKFPYLGANFEFLEKRKGDATFLNNIYCFNYASAISHGGLAGGDCSNLFWSSTVGPSNQK